MKKNNKTNIIYWSIGIIVLIVIIYSIVNSSPKVPIDIDRPDILGRSHVDNVSETNYSSNPPTSGEHLGSASKAGFYDYQLPDGNLVHSLEHGYIIINYDCSKIDGDCEELKNNIKSIVFDNSWKVIGNPRPENDHLISVTAWGKVMHLDSFDQDKIITFLKKYRNQGPEKTDN